MRCPAANVIPIPDHVAFEDAAAFPLVFLTAWRMLVTRARVRPGEDVLVWAAGSGVGMAAVQIAKLLGARVIATAGSADKLEQARALGADEVIDHHRQDVVAEVQRLTGKKGVDVVIEHVGQATWERSILSLAHRGRLVTCGATTGAAGRDRPPPRLREAALAAGLLHGQQGGAAGGGARTSSPGGCGRSSTQVLPLAEARARPRDDGGLRALREDRPAASVSAPPLPARPLARGRPPPDAARLLAPPPAALDAAHRGRGRRRRGRRPAPAARATWQPGDRAARPGARDSCTAWAAGTQATYGLATGLLACGRGWHVVRMNMRGAGDSARDLRAASTTPGSTATCWPSCTLVAAHAPRDRPWSASRSARTWPCWPLGRSGDGVPARGAAPWPRSRRRWTWRPARPRLERLGNRLYQRYFMRNLARRVPLPPAPAPRPLRGGPGAAARAPIREYDEAITAPYGGYRGAADYYRRSSAGPWLARDRPARP